MAKLDQLKAGLTSDVFSIYVTTEEAERFAEVVGEHPLIQRDEKWVVPTTYPIVYWQKADMPWLEGIGPLVHGEQSFHYEQPLLTEKEYSGHIELVKVEEKTGKLGTVVWLEHELIGYEDQEWEKPIFTCKTKAMFKPESEEEQ